METQLRVAFEHEGARARATELCILQAKRIHTQRLLEQRRYQRLESHYLRSCARGELR